MLVSNTADYIDYVTVDDFLKLQLAEPFRTFTDDDLINYSVREGNNKPNLYFAYGFVVANGWLVQNPSINSYSGVFGYDRANGVTIVVESIKAEKTTTDASAFDILRRSSST